MLEVKNVTNKLIPYTHAILEVSGTENCITKFFAYLRLHLMDNTNKLALFDLIAYYEQVCSALPVLEKDACEHDDLDLPCLRKTLHNIRLFKKKRVY